jgi:hypothetical protein
MEGGSPKTPKNLKDPKDYSLQDKCLFSYFSQGIVLVFHCANFPHPLLRF